MPLKSFRYEDRSWFDVMANARGPMRELLAKLDHNLSVINDLADDLARDAGMRVDVGVPLIVGQCLHNTAARTLAGALAFRMIDPAFDFDPVEFGKFAERLARDVKARLEAKMEATAEDEKENAGIAKATRQ